jgi:hypothetical protein
MSSIREQLSAARERDLQPVPFTSAATGAAVFLRRFSGVQRGAWDKFSSQSFDEKTGKLTAPAKYQAKLVALTLCEANGQLCFDPETELANVEALNGAFLEEIFLESVRLNMLTALEVAKARKGFTSTPASAPSTGSPSPAANPDLTGSADS